MKLENEEKIKPNKIKKMRRAKAAKFPRFMNWKRKNKRTKKIYTLNERPCWRIRKDTIIGELLIIWNEKERTTEEWKEIIGINRMKL